MALGASNHRFEDLENALLLFEDEIHNRFPPGEGRLTSRVLCSRFSDFLQDSFPSNFVNIWSFDPLNNHLILVNHSLYDDWHSLTIDCRVAISSKAIESKRAVIVHNIGRLKTPEISRNAEVFKRLGIDTVVSVPIVNTANSNQILLVIDFFLESSIGKDIPEFAGVFLGRFGFKFARLYETVLRERAVRVSRQLNLQLALIATEGREARTKAFAYHLQEVTNADVVMIFLEKASHEAIELEAVVGPLKSMTQVQLFRDELSRPIWRANREKLIPSLRNNPIWRFRSIRRAFDKQEVFCALVPIQDLQGRAQGVVLCLNHSSIGDQSQWRPFTYCDIAIIEAVGEAFAPHLAMILADERRNNAYSKVAHELRVPVVAFRAIVERMEVESREKAFTFRHPYLQEAANYSTLMSLLLKNLETLRTGVDYIPLRATPTRLAQDVAVPCIRFLAGMLRQRRFEPQSISYSSGLSDLPALYLDRLLMMQVFINLFENGVKYAGGDVKVFKIEIDAHKDISDIVIVFRDWGIGVPNSAKERIFDAGFRAENAIRSREPGDGLGLWLAREIVRRHGGTLVLGSTHQPTEFVIALPKLLNTQPPTTVI